MIGILTFIVIFGVLVTFHEFGHLYFAKKSGILVREFAIGMGPKIFAHMGKDGTAYTIRLLPLGGYVRMAGWDDDRTEIKVGSPATLTQNESGLVTRINLSERNHEQTALPILVTQYDLEDKLTISGEVLGEKKTFVVDHDATIVEEDGTEVRIAPKDVQYQNASIWGRLITNFAGPMNNFILGIIVFVILVFVQGGASDNSNKIQTVTDSPFAQAGGQSGDTILAIDNIEVSNWTDLQEAVVKATDNMKVATPLVVKVQTASGQTKELSVTPQKNNGSYVIGVRQSLKTGFWDKIKGGFEMAWQTAFLILNALKNLISSFSLNKLGGPVAIYQLSNQAAQSGIDSILYLMAMLSINIGIFNLFPIPALDGGKILINLIEMIRRKPLKQETETYVTLVGVAIMVILMIAVTWNDIMRAFF